PRRPLTPLLPPSRPTTPWACTGNDLWVSGPSRSQRRKQHRFLSGSSGSSAIRHDALARTDVYTDADQRWDQLAGLHPGTANRDEPAVQERHASPIDPARLLHARGADRQNLHLEGGKP